MMYTDISSVTRISQRHGFDQYSWNPGQCSDIVSYEANFTDSAGPTLPHMSSNIDMLRCTSARLDSAMLTTPTLPSPSKVHTKETGRTASVAAPACCSGDKLKSTVRFLTNPNNLLKLAKFVEYARAYAVVEAIVVVYSIGLSIKTQKCFQDLVNGSDFPLLIPVFFGWMLFAAKLLYFFPIIVHRFFFRVQRETTKSANRAKLAMCTRGLLKAQKRRIRKTNFCIDIIVLVWMI